MMLPAMLTPYLAGALLLIAIPGLLTFALAFTQYDGFNPPQWNGLESFTYLPTYIEFQFALRNTIVFVACGVPLRLLAALLFALLLKRRRRGISVYRMTAYLPTIIPDAAYALIWLWVFNPLYGPIAAAFKPLGIAPPNLLPYPDGAMLAIIIMAAFQFGEGFVVLLAGLHDIPDELHDAAAIDGGNRWQSFRYITLPLLRPWLVLLALRDAIILAQNNFGSVYMLTQGNPRRATFLLPQMVYEETFERFRPYVAAAASVVVFVCLGGALYVIFRVLRGWGYADEL